ncbi:hypothetical protein HK413_13280, partial [Mucilaginibacter sp. S1162]
MISTFFSHELKAFWRSKDTGKNIAVRIFMALLILYLLLCVAVAGWALDFILKKPSPRLIDRFVLRNNPDVFFYRTVLAPSVTRVAYAAGTTVFTVTYKTEYHYWLLALTAMFSVFNLWPIVLFFPFIFKVILHDAGAVTAPAFVVSILGISILNN